MNVEAQNCLCPMFYSNLDETFEKHLLTGFLQIQSPEISYLDKPSVLACVSSQPVSVIVFKAPNGNSPQCLQTGCTNVSGYQAVQRNSSYFELTILDLQVKHAGKWGCSEDGANFVYDQLVVAENKTSCTITWDAATVRLNQMVSLIVIIQDYYCSDTSNVTLLIGTVRDLLTTVEAKPTNTSLSREINVTAEHLGNIKLEFSCSGSRIISCSGLKHIEIPRPDDRLPPDNPMQVIGAVVITFLVTICVVIILWVIVYKREKVRDCLARSRRVHSGHSDRGHDATMNT
ncbi:uncharacterized protein [Haliotis asinina]|uniref:uncharacterized protein n=1 Tax=Haliotis asinina TaxID=109174 RepID=UPI003531C586